MNTAPIEAPSGPTPALLQSSTGFGTHPTCSCRDVALGGGGPLASRDFHSALLHLARARVAFCPNYYILYHCPIIIIIIIILYYILYYIILYYIILYIIVIYFVRV